MFDLFGSPSANMRTAFLLLTALSATACSSSQERAQSYYEHGKSLLEAHDYARAAIEFKNALRLKKDLLPAWRSLGEVDELTGQRGELVPIFRTIVELDPNDNAAKLKLAKLLLTAGSLDEALNLANAASEADSRNANAVALKALILFKLNDAGGAGHPGTAAPA